MTTRPSNVLTCISLSLAILTGLTPIAQADPLAGTGETVVVIDPTGIDVTHLELSDHVVEEVCITVANLCPDGSNLQVGKGAAAPIFDSDGNFKFLSGSHGTEVASVAVGKTVGIAPGASIIAIRAPTDVYIAFKWIADHAQQYKIASVVYSAGSVRSANKRRQDPCDLVYSQATAAGPLYFSTLFAQLRTMGIAIVIASGNDSELVDIGWPACITGVVSVGARWKDTMRLDGLSNSSPGLSLLAPDGVRVASVGPSGVHGYEDNAAGTSMSAPYVAGAVAILKASYPALTVDQEIAVLRTTGMPIDDEIVKQIPAVNLSAALAFLSSGKTIPSLASTFVTQMASVNQTKGLEGAKIINSLTNDLAELKSKLQSLQDSNALHKTQLSAIQTANESLTAQLASSAHVSPTSTPDTPISTITCTKGNAIFKISATKPICPSGYKKK